MSAVKKKRTRQQIIADFKTALSNADSDIKTWANDSGFSLGLVYSVTRGLNKGRRGKGKEVLEAMEGFHA